MVTTSTAYRWKTGARINVSADLAGAVCNELIDSVGLTPETLLEASRSEDAPLHKCFEWDDTVAAEKYRISQAGHIIRCLEITVIDKEPVNVRAYFPVADAGYEQIDVILLNADSTDAMLTRAKNEYIAYKKKYAILEQLAPMFLAADKVFDE